MAENAVAEKPKKTKYQFEVLRGIHRQDKKNFVKGDKVDTNDDLVKIHGKEKFRLVE